MASYCPQAHSMTPNTPLHLAIIPDGNRRWAKEKGFMNVWKGHEVAVENFRTLTEWCRNDERVCTLTVWCFSTENWKRPKQEISALMSMLETYLQKEGEEFLVKKTRFVHSGRKDRIPVGLKKIIDDTEEKTKNETGFTLHLAVDYGGMDEVTRSVQKITAERLPAWPVGRFPAAVNEEVIRAHLDHPELPDIDLVLRSSGEQRTSNFFLWQSAYAEWIFSPKYFPDIGTGDLDEALQEYERRKRRFGS